MKTGLIGLGNIGTAIARRLLSQGVELVVWNRTRERALALGTPTVEEPAELAGTTDPILLSLFDSNAVRDVLTGRRGLFAGDIKGKLVIDTTTNHFETVREFHDLCASRGVSYLESPVLGSVAPASQGILTVLVSGEEEAYRKALPLLRKIGRKIHYLGRPGLATSMKLVNNMVLGAIMHALAEALAAGEGIGLTREVILEILAEGAGDSMVLNVKRSKLIAGDYSPQFSTAAIYKDLLYMEDLAGTLGKDFATLRSAKEAFGSAKAAGLDLLDFSAVYRAIR